MLVYSVLLDDGEHFTFCGVFDSPESADRYVRSLEGFQRGWYQYGIVESRLGEPLEFGHDVDWVK